MSAASPSGPSDAGALVAALERLIDQPELGPRLGAAGRAWVLAERTWAADGARYRDLYESVLERFDPASAVTAPLPAATPAVASAR